MIIDDICEAEYNPLIISPLPFVGGLFNDLIIRALKADRKNADWIVFQPDFLLLITRT